MPGVEMTRLYGAEGLDLDCVTDLLLSGQLVALPTETVYGLAGDALREDVVRQIFDVKMRPFIDPLIVHIAELRQGKILAEISPEVELLAGEVLAWSFDHGASQAPCCSRSCHGRSSDGCNTDACPSGHEASAAKERALSCCAQCKSIWLCPALLARSM